jgi:hypothetical protein
LEWSSVPVAPAEAILRLSFGVVKKNLCGTVPTAIDAPQQRQARITTRREQDEKVNRASLSSKPASLLGKSLPFEGDRDRGQ